MSFKPYHTIMGDPPKPQFYLKDLHGRAFGVVEHYNTDARKNHPAVLLEFISPDIGPESRPLLWLDLDQWSVVAGQSRNLPEADFEAGLNAYLQEWPEAERTLRRDRCRKARFAELVGLAEKGYSVAYQELFPGELRREDFPEVVVGGKVFLVDDQYNIQPGDFIHQVTLVLVPAEAVENRTAISENHLLFNWLFGEGYEILDSRLSEEDAHRIIRELTANSELEKIYRERLAKMRREGVLLGVSPKPYQPFTDINPGADPT